MKLFRLGGFCLGALGVVACATAQDGAVSSDGSAGASSGGSLPSTFAGSTSTSGSTSTGTSGSTSTGGSIGSTFGGSAGMLGGSGSAGTTGASGSAGSGGLANGGASGAGTSGGGGGGAGGSAGAGGSGGAPPVFDTGVCATSPTVALSYLTPATPPSITTQYQFSNTSDTPIPVAQLKIRYFFSNEEIGGWSTHVYSSQIDGGSGGYRPMSSETSLNIVKLAQALDGADSYIELTFNGAETLEKGATASVSWELQPQVYSPPPAQLQSNDYSYNAADKAFTPWDHIAIYQSDTLVGGCVPKALDGTGGTGGSAGSGGAAGTGGASTGGSSGAGTGGTAGTGAGDTSAGAGGASAGTGGTAAAGGAAGSAGAGTGGSDGTGV
ncbi:MAG TPA: cellulose binding domain-containing protein [Polyangiaceae bacterium]|jgi:hypothetical protein